MQKIKDVLRLHLLGGVDSCRRLASAVGCGKSAVADCLRRARVANLNDWASVAELDEVELSRRLYPAAGATASRSSARPMPDWIKVREELARRDHQMTLALLWEEYKGQHPDGYQYSQFADLYRRFEKRLSIGITSPGLLGGDLHVVGGALINVFDVVLIWSRYTILDDRTAVLSRLITAVERARCHCGIELRLMSRTQ
jgi:hypothetical protein